MSGFLLFMFLLATVMCEAGFSSNECGWFTSLYFYFPFSGCIKKGYFSSFCLFLFLGFLNISPFNHEYFDITHSEHHISI